MRYHALACDYDGTIAFHGGVPPEVVAGLERVRKSGRRLLLATGRQVDDLLSVCPDVGIFDLVVAENGAVLFDPATRQHTVVLPSGVNKATGLIHGLHALRLPPRNAVGVGDAENDHAFLAACECSVAVANALPALKERADIVTSGERGAGVLEIVDGLLRSDLRDAAPPLGRHRVPIGTTPKAPRSASSPTARTCSWPAPRAAASRRSPPPSSRASPLAAISSASSTPKATTRACPWPRPSATSIARRRRRRPWTCSRARTRSHVINLLGLPTADRPAFFAALLPRLQELRAQTGRPHWLVVDEAHHLLPDSWDKAGITLPLDLHGLMLITVHPEHMAEDALAAVHRVVAIGGSPDTTIQAFADRLGLPAPVVTPGPLAQGEAITWTVGTPAPVHLRTILPKVEHRRHVRKYAHGELAPDRSFYFEGPEGKLHLRAQNLPA